MPTKLGTRGGNRNKWRETGMAEPNRGFNLRISPPLYEVMRRHAFERGTSLNGLITDVLRLWAIAATDPTDPLFAPSKMGVSLPEPPRELYPGYLDSLVFLLPAEDQSA